jgi:hypothetical protein
MSKTTKQFTRTELLAMPSSQFFALVNSDSEELNGLSAAELREIGVALGLYVEQEVVDDASDAEAEYKPVAEWQKTFKRDLLESDRQSVQADAFEDMTQHEILDAFEKAQRNERLKSAGQEDVLDNADDADAEPPRNDNNNNHRPSDDPRYEQARDDADFVLRASDDALNAALKEKLGVTTDEVAKLKEANAINQSRAIQQQFIARHPDFLANERNGSLMRDHVLARGESEFTEANLEAAFSALKDVVTASATPQQPRNVRRSSSVSTRGKSSPVVQTEMSMSQLEALAATMPLDKFRELCIEKAKSGEHGDERGGFSL